MPDPRALQMARVLVQYSTAFPRIGWQIQFPDGEIFTGPVEDSANV